MNREPAPIDIERLVAAYPPQKIRFFAALAAAFRLIRNPQDTRQVSLLEIALGGCSPRRIFARFLDTPHGRAVLAERRSLVEALDDHERLRALPPNTFGRHYLAFVESHGLSAKGLFDATQAFSDFLANKSEATRIFSNYTQRGSHDLYHVLGGYGRDELGEACVVAMAYEQIGVRGYKVIATVGPLVIAKYLRRAGLSPRGVFAAAREAAQIGRKAAWIPSVDLEAALAEDIDHLRQRLSIASPRRYLEILDRVRSSVTWSGHEFARLPPLNPGRRLATQG